MPMEYPVPDPLDVEQIFSNSIPPSYVMRVRDSTYYADPQDEDLPKFEGSVGHEVIQSAVDALPSSGGRIHFDDGIFIVSLSISEGSNINYNSKSNVTLTGNGRSSIIKLKDGATKTDEGAIIINSGPNATIKDLTIDGNWENQGSIAHANDGCNITTLGNTLVTNVKSKNSTGDGIEFGGKDCIALGNLIDNCWEHGIHIHEDRNIVAHNVIKNTNSHGAIAIWDGSADVYDAQILGNTIDGTTNGPGIQLECASPYQIINPTVKNNTIRGTASEGVYGVRLVRASISGNKIMNTSTGSGIRITADKSEDLDIKDNYVEGADFVSIFLENIPTRIRITGNKLVESGAEGIKLGSLAGDIQDIRIADNEIRDANMDASGRNGITVNPGSYTISHIKILDNFVYGDKATPYYAIGLGSGFSDCLVAENDSYNINKWQLYDFGARGEITVKNNKDYTTEAQGTATVASGNTSTGTIYPELGDSESVSGQDIQATPLGDLGSASYFWVGDVGVAAHDTFEIHVDADPTQDVDFAWEVKINP